MHDSLSDVRATDYSVGLHISLPLFDGGVRKWEREKSFHELKKAQEYARLVFNEKNKDIKTLRVGYAELSKSYSYYKKINEQYEKIKDINRKSKVLGEEAI
jgi:outer membrane protein TolC